MAATNTWARLEHERLIQRLFLKAGTATTDVRPCGCMRDPLVFGHGNECLRRANATVDKTHP